MLQLCVKTFCVGDAGVIVFTPWGVGAFYRGGEL
jgi:hypothetical protein